MWYLYAAQQQLAGTTLYGSHLVDTNPPLIIWFSAIPVVLSRMLHIRPEAGLWCVLSVMILGSIVWSLRILRRSPRRFSDSRLGLLGCALTIAEFAQFISPGHRFLFLRSFDFAFGQREHLLVILIFPYVLAKASRAAQHLGLAERCALGVAAGLGVCFKPQQVMVVLTLELFLAIYTRQRLRQLFTPEILAVAGTGICYLLLVRWLTPLYIVCTVLLLRDTYWAVGGLTLAAVAGMKRNVFCLLLTAIPTILLLGRARDRLMAYALVACIAGAETAFLLQHKGWGYQLRPVIAFAFFLVLYLIFDFMEPAIERLNAEWPKRPILALTATASLLVLILLEMFQVPKRMALPPAAIGEFPQIDKLLTQFKPGVPVSVLATELTVFPPVYRHQLTWASRFPCLWLLPALVRNEEGAPNPRFEFKRLSPERVASLADLQRTSTAEDLDSWRPPMVIVERCDKYPCAYLEGYNFDMLAWFGKSQRFQSAWSHYQLQSMFPAFAVYRRIN
jgi:hypothetical protein